MTSLELNRFYRPKWDSTCPQHWKSMVFVLTPWEHDIDFVKMACVYSEHDQDVGKTHIFTRNEIEPIDYEYPDEHRELTPDMEVFQ